jgi:hypothetical protein
MKLEKKNLKKKKRYGRTVELRPRRWVWKHAIFGMTESSTSND